MTLYLFNLMNHVRREWTQNRRMKGYYKKMKKKENIRYYLFAFLDWIPNLEVFRFDKYLVTEIILTITPIE